MNEEEVKIAHDELRARISRVLTDFSDKYFKNLPSEKCRIIQSVIVELLSENEYYVGQAPFTAHQIDHICSQIGHWYIMMKPLLEGQHNLGYQKEVLKTMICGDE